MGYNPPPMAKVSTITSPVHSGSRILRSVAAQPAEAPFVASANHSCPELKALPMPHGNYGPSGRDD